MTITEAVMSYHIQRPSHGNSWLDRSAPYQDPDHSVGYHGKISPVMINNNMVGQLRETNHLIEDDKGSRYLTCYFTYPSKLEEDIISNGTIDTVLSAVGIHDPRTVRGINMEELLPPKNGHSQPHLCDRHPNPNNQLETEIQILVAYNH